MLGLALGALVERTRLQPSAQDAVFVDGAGGERAQALPDILDLHGGRMLALESEQKFCLQCNDGVPARLRETFDFSASSSIQDQDVDLVLIRWRGKMLGEGLHALFKDSGLRAVMLDLSPARSD
jgi:hypothetical protein